MPAGKIERCVLAVPAMAFMLCVAAGPVAAGPIGAFRDVFHLNRDDPGRPKKVKTARYVTDDGHSFVLDFSYPEPLIRFDDSPEVWVLQSSYAPRGDLMYRDDTGQLMVRVTSIGGVTLFGPARPGGSPAAMVGPTSAIRMLPPTPATLLQQLARASVRASHAARHLISFEAPDVTRGAETVYADGAVVTAEAVIKLSGRKNGGALLNRVQRVQLTQGGKVGVSLDGSTLKVRLNPAKGLAGRPSSKKILSAMK